MINVNEDSWMEVVGWATKRLAEHRAELESLHCDDKRTDQLRGMVAALNELIALPTKKTPPQVSSGANFLF